MKDVDRRSLREPAGSSSGKGPSKARELRAMALRLNRLADELESNPRLADAMPLPPQPFGSFPDSADHTDHLTGLAHSIQLARRRRNRWFDRGIFGEPGWDLLLDAFQHRANRKPLTTKSACYASAVPSTTALRWIGVLEEAGLVRRIPSEQDRRIMMVELTDEGFRAMTCYLLEFQDSAPKATGP